MLCIRGPCHRLLNGARPWFVADKAQEMGHADGSVHSRITHVTQQFTHPLCCGRLCIWQVMPYVSLCSQKAAYLEKLLAPLERSVKPMYGGLGGTSITPGETGAPRCCRRCYHCMVSSHAVCYVSGQGQCMAVLGSVRCRQPMSVKPDPRGTKCG